MTTTEPALRISPDLVLPLEAVTQTFAILAKRGAGKTNAGVVMAEEMVAAGIPWVAIDPVGSWFGIRADGDGGPGLPVVVFGGEHGDLPLEPTAGAVLADMVIDQRDAMPWVVFDLSDMSDGDLRRFVTAFVRQLYRRNRLPLHLFLEEAEVILPQQVRANDAPMVGAVQKLIKLGRGRGLGCTLITQRSASVNKDGLTQVETLIAMRTTSPQDRAAILAWVKDHETGAEAVAALPELDAGHAYVFSPAWLGTLALIRFRRRRTFDSGATPELGQPIAPINMADLDLGAVKDAMAETIEKAEAEDPKRLHARIRELERQLADARRPNDGLVLDEPQLADLRSAVHDTYDQLDEVRFALGRVSGILTGLELPAAAKEGRAVQAGSSAPAMPITPGERTTPGTATSGKNPAGTVGDAPRGPAGPVKLGRTERRILAVLTQHGPRTHRQMALQTGYSAKASTIGVAMAHLRKLGYAAPGQPYTATDAGLAALAQLGGVEPLPTGPALLDYWRGQLGKTENAVLAALLKAYPDVLRQSEIAEATGYSPTASTIGVALSKLRRLELVDGWGVSDDFARSIR